MGVVEVNRQQRRQLQHEQHAHVRQLPERLTLIPRDEWPTVTPMPIKAWLCRRYVVQLYDAANATYPALLRLSVNRSRVSSGGGWKAEITWDELQAIKREIGYGHWYAVEVYPPDANVINVANLRHQWRLPTPLEIGWF